MEKVFGIPTQFVSSRFLCPVAEFSYPLKLHKYFPNIDHSVNGKTPKYSQRKRGKVTSWIAELFLF